MSKVFTDADIKMEILIKLAFGYSYLQVAKEYQYSVSTIMNLRKNNYKVYNSLVDHFRILDEVAVLGLLPLQERAVNICKKFYKQNFEIITDDKFVLKGVKLNIMGVIEEANRIIALDNIPPLASEIIKKNYYIKKKEQAQW